MPKTPRQITHEIIPTFTFRISFYDGFVGSGSALCFEPVFYPNVTLKADYNVPSNLGGGTGKDFGYSRAGFFGIMPIQSEVQLGYSLQKKFDLRAVHTVLLTQYTQIQPAVEGKNIPDNGYKTLSVGVIRLQASIKDRLWVYGGGLGMTESNETFLHPNHFSGVVLRGCIFLDCIHRLCTGSILTYNQKVRFVPVFGLNKRFGETGGFLHYYLL